MSFAECNEGCDDMILDEVDFSDEEHDGESKKDQSQATNDKTDTS